MQVHGRALGVSVALVSALIAVASGGGCGDDESSGGGASSSSNGSSSSTSSGSGAGGSSGGSSSSSSSGAGAGGGASSSSGSGGGGDIPGGGTVLFEEPFDDANYGARGWYDGPAGTIDGAEHAPGSPSSFQCFFQSGATSCSAGKPARHKIADSESVYLSFWLKFSSNWVGSGKPYHPHMFHFINNLESDWVGPAFTALTTYTEVVQGKAVLALQDGKNVDLSCILKNDDTFVGCNGDFDTYPFTEDRSVCSCNGLMGYLDGRDCFPVGGGNWYSARMWRSAAEAFGDGGPPFDKDSWHFVEVYFEMNSIQGGVAVADGKIRWVQDGQSLISSDQILLRTGAHASLAFNQFAMLPYIGDGSPVDQQFWVDDLTVATARP